MPRDSNTWVITAGHAQFNIPDVPGLRDSSAIIGNLCELDSAVVIYLSYPHWAQAWLSAMLALYTSFDCCYVSYIVRVWSALSVFMLIVLKGKSLLVFLNELQSAWNEAFSIVSQPNTNYVGVARDVVCTVEFMAFRHAARTPWKPKNLSKSLLSLI